MAHSQPGVVLMGGGTDTEEAFEWQIRNADGGDFVIMRTGGTDAYNEWVYNISSSIDAQLNSVTTLVMGTKADSHNSSFLDHIQNAEAIFFAGGNQAEYMAKWVNTPVQQIIQSKLATTSVGGTSAGLAILGGHVFTANSTYVQENGLVSSDTLADPNSGNITLSSAFLQIPLLSSVLTDTHFCTRNRMGRMLTFLSRLLAPMPTDGYAPSQLGKLHAIGIDEQTAVLVNTTTGLGTVVGQSTAYLCTPTAMPEMCSVHGKSEMCEPLTIRDIACTRFYGQEEPRQTINFRALKTPADKSVAGPVAYNNTIVDGEFTQQFPLQYGPLPNPTPDFIHSAPASPNSSSDGGLGTPAVTAILACVLIAIVIGAVAARKLLLGRQDSSGQKQLQLQGQGERGGVMLSPLSADVEKQHMGGGSGVSATNQRRLQA